MFGLIGSAIGAAGNVAAAKVQANQSEKNLGLQFGYQKKLNEQQYNFNSQEAEKARQWQEDYYNQYQSPAALMRQYQDAGMNPILANGISPSTPPSASSAQGSAGSVGLPQSPNLMGIVDSILNVFTNIMRIKNENKLTNAQVENYESSSNLNNAKSAETFSNIDLNKSIIGLNKSAEQLNISAKTIQDIETTFKPQLYAQQLQKGIVEVQSLKTGIDVALKTIDKIDADILAQQIKSYCEQNQLKIYAKDIASVIKSREFDNALKSAQVALATANEKSIDLDSAEKLWDKQFREFNGVKPDTPIWSLVTQLVGSLNSLLHNTFNF